MDFGGDDIFLPPVRKKPGGRILVGRKNWVGSEPWNGRGYTSPLIDGTDYHVMKVCRLGEMGVKRLSMAKECSSIVAMSSWRVYILLS